MAAQTTFVFEGPPEASSLATWPAGTVPVYVYAKKDGAEACLMWPRLYRAQNAGQQQGDNVYDTGTDAAPPSEVVPVILTNSWVLYAFAVPVRARTGPMSDRMFFVVVCESANSGPVVHVGSDGGANQTKVETLFFDPPAKPTSLERNPDGWRPDEVVTTSLYVVPGSSVSSPIATFDSHVGDPGVVVWRARTWRMRIWARVTSGTATITADLGRKDTGGTVVPLAMNVAVATVTSSTWTLFRADVAVAESAGGLFGIFDVISVVLTATSSTGAVLLVAVGTDHPSSINTPLLVPAGGTVVAPADDGKVMTESDSPRWYLRDAVQSSDGSIVPTVDPTSLRLDLVFGGSGYVRPNCSTSMGAGWLWLIVAEHGHTDHINWTATGDFNGISKLWQDGTPVADRKEAWVYINNATPANPVIVRDGSTPPAGSPYLPLALPAAAGVAAVMEFDGPTELCFWLNLAEGRWHLRSYQSYTVVP